MEIAKFVVLLFLIYEPFFYLVAGEKNYLGIDVSSECTKLYFFLKGEKDDKGQNCCTDHGVYCEDGHVVKFDR